MSFVSACCHSPECCSLFVAHGQALLRRSLNLAVGGFPVGTHLFVGRAFIKNLGFVRVIAGDNNRNIGKGDEDIVSDDEVILCGCFFCLL